MARRDFDYNSNTCRNLNTLQRFSFILSIILSELLVAAGNTSTVILYCGSFFFRRGYTRQEELKGKKISKCLIAF